MKSKIDGELRKFIEYADEHYSLNKLSPLLFKVIKDFILREGKRVRPILFITAYNGFTKRPAGNLYMSAIAMELLHDYMLIHDDVIDKSDTRRGKPSVHAMLDSYLAGYRGKKCNGQDLAICVGDVVYAMAIGAFLSVKEDLKRKESALKRFVESAAYTGIGEFEELLLEVKDLKKIKRDDIYKIYDLKTAYYTFACPLSGGALLAGANKNQSDILSEYGMCIGRAFQIQDDILGMFGEEKATGKSSLTDLQEGKKTILLWYAYNNSDKKDKSEIEKILKKKRVDKTDLLRMREIIRNTGALGYAEKEIRFLIAKADMVILRSKMRPQYKNFLVSYSKKFLNRFN